MMDDFGNEVSKISKQLDTVSLELRECSNNLIQFNMQIKNINKDIGKHDAEITKLKLENEQLKQKEVSLSSGLGVIQKILLVCIPVIFSACSWVAINIIDFKQNSVKNSLEIIRLDEKTEVNRKDIETMENKIFTNNTVVLNGK